MRNLSLFAICLGMLASSSPEASGINVGRQFAPLSAEASETLPPFDSKSDFRHLPTRSGEELDNSVIHEAPEGKVEHYNTTGSAYMAIMGMVGNLPVEDFDTEMVFCDNGEVYWKNCITMMAPNTYIKGIDKGDVIEFTFPQCIMSYPDENGAPVNIYAHRMKYELLEGENSGWFYVDTDNDVVTLTKGDDGTLTGDVLGGEAILGMTTPDGQWYGYGNYDIVMTPGLNVAVAPPAGLETEEWMIISDGVGQPVNIGFDGDDVYVTNVFGVMPDCWFKGHVDGDKVVFPSNQFVGVFEQIQFNAYFKTTTLEYDEDIDEDVVVEHDQATCTYDAAGRVMVSDIDFALLAGPGFRLDYIEKPTIKWQPADFEISLENPVILDCFNYDYYLNYGVLAFEMSALTKEGYALDPDCIFFRMFVDGEEYTFEPEDYEIDEPLVWVPFLMDNYDIHSYGSYHRFDHFIDGADTYGVQAKYDDGETVYYTDIVSCDLSGIDKVTSSGADVTDTTYTTLSGMKAADSAKGLLIKTEKLSDGTTRVTKTLRR